MPFAKAACTDALLCELAAPPILEKEIGAHPVGRELIYDVSRKIGLFPHPFHHSSYPDQSFTLVVDGQFLRVWEKVGVGAEGNRVEIYVSKETEHFEDDALVRLVREAFSVLKGVGQFSAPIRVRNRTPPPITPREPAKIIASLNKFIDLMPPGTENVARDLFVPVLVRPEELDALLRYGRATDWSGLNPATKKFFSNVLKSLENHA